MADELGKQKPGAAPGTLDDLASRVGPAGTAPRDSAGLRVHLDVHGGIAGERYELRLQLDDTGEIQVSLLDEMRKTELPARMGKVGRSDFLRVVQGMDVGRMAESSRGRPAIPPDSLVGRLTIGDRRQERSVLFMADRGQAEAAGFRLEPGVEKVVDILYRLAARQLDRKDVRP